MKKGWKMITVGEACDKGSSNVSQNKLTNEVGPYAIYGASGYIKNVSFYHNEKPYLSIVKDGSGVGRVTKMEAFTSTIGTLQYIFPKEGIDLNYLYYSLISIDFKKYVAGAAIPHIYFKDYKNEPFLWMPLPEQQAIVAILDETFAAIEKAKQNTERNLQNARELFRCCLNQKFSNDTEQWKEKTFEDLIHENQIGLIKAAKEQGKGKKYRYLKMDSITADNTLTHDKYVYVDATKDELKKYSLDNGDFLFNTRNSYDLVGKTCVFKTIDDELTLFNNNIMRVKFVKEVLPEFINYAFSTEVVKKRLEKLKSGTTSVVGIYYKGLRNLLIPLVEHKSQRKFVQELDALKLETQKLEAIYQKKLDDLEELKKSILQKAFSGELKSKRNQTQLSYAR